MTDPTKKILVVDDHPDNLDLLTRRLRRRGYQVVAATSGLEALRRAAEEVFDLVLLDVMMPEMSGLEVLAELRKAHSSVDLPVIMATAQSSSDDVVRSLDLGANDHVVKPIDFDVLIARMRVHLRKQEVTRASLVPSSLPPASGNVLEAKYQLERKLGTGGFGSVYRAKHLQLETYVAVKVLHAHLLESTQMRARFEREGISACRVRHPNAVAVLDAGTTTSGAPYLVMELLEGPSLLEELNRHGLMRLGRVAQIAVPVCEVLMEAHSAGVIHRDIKPGNILLAKTSRGETVKVLDFGIAKLVGELSSLQTGGDQVLGTPNYMSPERLLGKHADERCDTYSIGAMLYEMLSGQPPFGAPLPSPFGQAMRQLQGAPAPLSLVRPDLPHAVIDAVMRCLSASPDNRPTLSMVSQTLNDWGERFYENVWPPATIDPAVARRALTPAGAAGSVDTTVQLEGHTSEPAIYDPSTIKPMAAQPEQRESTTKRGKSRPPRTK